MSVSLGYFPHYNTHLPSSATKFSRRRCMSSASISMESQNGRQRSFMEFPYLTAPHKNLMVDLVSTVENRLDSQLLPCKLPPDVQYYENPTATAHASVNIRSGAPSSQIDFILGSWLHCELPNGAALNITTLSGFLNSSTDAPNFFIDLIQNSPTSYILVVDLPPRKDLVLHETYLKTFYEETQLEKQRQNLYNLPDVQPYFSSSFFVRSFVSPTAILVRIESQNAEDIVQDHVGPIAKEVLNVWLDLCACGKRQVGENEKEGLSVRDQIIKRKTYEIDLATNLPKLFGKEVASRVLEELEKVFCK